MNTSSPDREVTTPYIHARASLPITLSDTVDSYLSWVELEKGRSKNTVLGYENDVTQFAAFLVEKYALSSWENVQGEYIEQWQAGLTLNNYSNASSARKMTAIRGFLRFLAAEGITHGALADNIKGPKLLRKLPQTLSVEDLDKLLKAPDASTAQGLRDRAIMELAYSSGLRVSEICSMRIEDVDTKEGVLRVISGKGSKDRVVPMGRQAVKALERYLVTARGSYVRRNTGSYIFLSSRGLPISRKTVWHLIKQYAGKCGLDARRIKPHILRHSFASHLLAGGADLRVIQEMLGHADIATTQIYTRVDSSLLMDQHSQYHPRRRMDQRRINKMKPASQSRTQSVKSEA
jgi:integrase/recombinase XerD